MRPILRLMLAFCYAACDSGSSSTTKSGAALHAEVEALKGFSYDSSYVPSDSPLQVDLKLGAGGKITLDAPGAKPGSGKFALDANITFAALLKSSLPGASYEGPIKGAPDLNLRVAGEAAFDPMSVGSKATLTAEVAPTDLVMLPLATVIGVPGVDGTLDLKVNGGTVTSEFVGVCAMDGKYSGTVTTSGMLKLAGSLTAKVPILGSKTFDIPEISVDIPAIESSLNFTSRADPMGVGCSASSGSQVDGGAQNGDGGGAQNGDAGIGQTDGGNGGGGQNWTASVTINGQAMTVTAASIELPTDGFSSYNANVNFGGPGFPGGSVFFASVFRMGGGCSSQEPYQEVGIYPPVGVGDWYYYFSADGANCGLQIDKFPQNAGDHLVGRFSGTVLSQKGDRSIDLSASFDIPLGQ